MKFCAAMTVASRVERASMYNDVCKFLHDGVIHFLVRVPFLLRLQHIRADRDTTTPYKTSGASEACSSRYLTTREREVTFTENWSNCIFTPE